MKKKIRVLVVDDEPDIIEIIKDMFELFGFDIESASSGNQAIETLKSEDFDIVVSDVKMPDGSGIDLLDYIKSENANKPSVLFISGYTDFSLEEMMDLGIDGFFAKPFDASAIANAVRNTLASPNQRWSHPTSDEPKHRLSIQTQSVLLEKSPAQLGRGGLFLEWSENFPNERDVVAFDITVKDGIPVNQLKGLGRVTWVRSGTNKPNLMCGIGLEIVHLEGGILSDVVSYISESNLRAFIPIGQ